MEKEFFEIHITDNKNSDNIIDVKLFYFDNSSNIRGNTLKL